MSALPGVSATAPVRALTGELWLIRHAESTWNAEGRWQGQLDPPLSARGREQAARLAEQLAAQAFEVLVSSDLTRSLETARVVAARLGLPLHEEPALRELDAGSWSGLSRAQIADRDAAALASFDTGAADARAGGGESRGDVARRARAALRRWAERHPDARLACFTHSGVIRSLFPPVRVANAEAWVLRGEQIASLWEERA